LRTHGLDRQRIDKWLWHARVVRTRSAAAMLASSGHVRVNGRRIEAASYVVRVGDVITVALDRTVRVLKVQNFAQRRGSPQEARSLSELVGPPAGENEQHVPPAQRAAGSGRPTKRERRAIGQFIGEDEQ
jgi:ribosome-associated heat shock protein Hsp15